MLLRSELRYPRAVSSAKDALVPLSCAGCGAPLELPAEGEVVRCPFCKREHVFALAPASLSSGRKDAHPPGSLVMVEWGGKWWNATVVAEQDGRWRIHSDGWSDRWDEMVGANRIGVRDVTHRPADPVARGSLIAVLAVIVVTVIVAWIVASHDGARPSARSTPAGTAIDDATVIGKGERVEVLDRGSWYSATVLAVESDGGVRVHYEGWSSSYDEAVARPRVRVFGAHASASARPVSDAALAASTEAPPGVALVPGTVLHAGDPVWAQSQGAWWRAEIVKPVGKRYEVRYIGYGPEWNETLDFDSVRARKD